MAVGYKQPRNNRAALNAKIAGSTISVGQIYLITDEQRLSVGLTANTVADVATKAEVDAINANNWVTNARLRDSAALSVIGNPTNATADPADIAAGSDGHVLFRSGTSLIFGQLPTASIADNAITDVKMSQIGALSVVANPTNATANRSTVAAGTDGHVLRRNGTALEFALLQGVNIAVDTVTNTNLAPMATMTLKGNNTGATAGPQDIAISALKPTILAPSIQSILSASTITPTFSDDQVNVTALAVNATIAAPTGTAVDGWGIVLRIKDNGTTRTLTWNAIYRAINIALPAGTVAGKVMYVGMVYNVQDTKWDVVSVAQEL